MVLCESPCVHGGALALQLMIRVALFASLCETLQVLAFIRVMFILFLVVLVFAFFLLLLVFCLCSS
jgi:hypothetical protein